LKRHRIETPAQLQAWHKQQQEAQALLEAQEEAEALGISDEE
jgi:hypothetical protein